MLSFFGDIFPFFLVKNVNTFFVKSIGPYFNFCNYEPIFMKFSEFILLSNDYHYFGAGSLNLIKLKQKINSIWYQ